MRLGGTAVAAAWIWVCAGSASAQHIGGTWQDLGPAPSYRGQVENITNREVTGAVNQVLTHPTNPDVIYVGAVNGGVWRTTNATAASPIWTRLTDALRSPSIGALEFDPTDPNRQTLIAGIARTSSYLRLGGAQIGLLRTTDGGTTWTVIDGGGALNGRNVIGVAARGAVLVAATNNGVYRSINGGTSFTLISNGDGSSTGLPAGANGDLANDPINSNRLYVTQLSNPSGGSRGIYRSEDQGASWTKISNAEIDTLFDGSVSAAEVVVGARGVLYAGVVNGGRLAGVFRSPDQGATWQSLGIPTTVEGTATQGIHPGGQGAIHFSIAADPDDEHLVYLGGDRQPLLNEGGTGPTTFPNSLGALDFTGRLFRGDARQPPASRWTSLTHSGTSNNSAPHADSRDMAFDAAGNLIEVDDGGIYKRTAPRNSSGQWLSLIGNLAVTEYHGIAYDRVSDRVIGGAQDTGTTEQTSLTSRIFDSVSTADGGDTAVDDFGNGPTSTRYSSFQNLGQFRRRVLDAAGVVQSTASVALTPIAPSPAVQPQFYTPIATNEAASQRLLIGANNGVYESFDRGATVNRISTIRVNRFLGDPMVYGVTGNPDYVLVAEGTGVYLRDGPPPAALTLIATLPAEIRDLTVDPDDVRRVFAITSNAILYSFDGGFGFSSIAGNLSTLDVGEFRTLAYIPGTPDALVLGADRGVVMALETSNYAGWRRLGNGLAYAPVYELDYDPVDRVLVAGLMGRGAWKLGPIDLSGDLFRNGFEPVLLRETDR